LTVQQRLGRLRRTDKQGMSRYEVYEVCGIEDGQDERLKGKGGREMTTGQ